MKLIKKVSKAICQSCAIPLRRDSDKGVEKNGVFSEIYCNHCYRMGSFIDPKMTVEKMHENLRVKLLEMKFPRFLAKLMANQVYTLQRWGAAKA